MFLLVPDVSIAFIYFNHKEHPSAAELIGSLLKQLLQQGTGISSKIRDLYFKHSTRDTRPSLDEISDLLVLESRSVSKLYMVADALDECPADANTREKVLVALQKLFNLHLLITSRPHLDISSEFSSIQYLDIRADNNDMEAYVLGRLKDNRNLRRYIGRDFQEIVEEIVRKSDGM